MKCPRFLVTSFAAALLALPAISAEPAELIDGIEQLLACRERPDASALLTYLSSTGRIDVDSSTGADSMNCWTISPPLDVAGAEFDGICVSYPEPLHIAAFPKFYWRGPGTSPGAYVGLTTTTRTPNDLQVWADEFLPYRESASTAAAYFTEGSQVSCSDFDLIDDGP